MQRFQRNVTARTSEPCPRTGDWVVQKSLDGTTLIIKGSIDTTMRINEGSPMLQYEGKDVIWLLPV